VTDLTIRSATLAEEDAVVALWQACGLVVSYNDPIKDFRFAKASPCSDILVGLDPAGEIKASVMVGYDGHRGWLYYVAVDPDGRHNGFGRQIIDAAQDWLRQRGVAKVQLMVRDTNTAVVSFYERLGFEVAPRVVMAKWLDEKQ